MYSYGPPHMAVQKQDDQHEHTFSSYVRIRDVVLKTYLRRWTIGRSGERGSGISVLPARYDDDDDYYLALVVLFAISVMFLHRKLIAKIDHTWANILDRRPILFRKFNIFLGSIFPNSSFMLLLLKKFLQVRVKVVHSIKICFTVYWFPQKHLGSGSSF